MSFQEAMTLAVNSVLTLHTDLWYMRDEDNNTIGHIAALVNRLPEGFKDIHPNIWIMENKFGKTVEDIHNSVEYARYM